jgi:hypothetical protein
MKNFILVLSLFTSLLSFSQDYKFNTLSVVSPNRDTLWILNDPSGRLIAYSWELDKNPTEKKPVIILVKSLPTIEGKKKKKGYIEGN